MNKITTVHPLRPVPRWRRDEQRPQQQNPQQPADQDPPESDLDADADVGGTDPRPAAAEPEATPNNPPTPHIDEYV